MSQELKFDLTAGESASRRRVTRIQILQGDSACFAAKNPVLLSGEAAYEKDTKRLKIGDGISSWNELPYKIDQVLNSEMVRVIEETRRHLEVKGAPGGYASLDPNGKIPKAQIPDSIKTTTVVETISERDNIPYAERYQGLFVFVIDAEGDRSVQKGSATYIWTDSDWKKVSEAESMDIDNSVFLLKSKNTLDDINAGQNNIHFTTEDRDKLDSIEYGASSDLSSQEIASMYQSIPGVSGFSDQLRKKLEEIEQGATNDSPEEIRGKLESLLGAERLDADYIQSGARNKFFTDKEQGQLDSIIEKLKAVENGATNDTPEKIRDKLQTIVQNNRLNADFLQNGLTNKFLTPKQLEDVEKIIDLQKDTENLQERLGNINEQAIKNICSEKEENLVGNCNSKISKILDRIDALKRSELSGDIDDLDNEIKSLETAIKIINERIAGLEDFVVKKNKAVESFFRETKVKLSDFSVKLRSDFISNLNQKLNLEIKELENTIESQINTVTNLITPENIKRLYESNPDANAFTDAQYAKLAGIQEKANITNYESVNNSGAIMEGNIIFGGDCIELDFTPGPYTPTGTTGTTPTSTTGTTPTSTTGTTPTGTTGTTPIGITPTDTIQTSTTSTTPTSTTGTTPIGITPTDTIQTGTTDTTLTNIQTKTKDSQDLEDSGEDSNAGGCETAFALGNKTFADIVAADPVNFPEGIGKRWGWQISVNLDGSKHSAAIYAGAGQSDITKGTFVGQLHYSYNGSSLSVEYSMNPGFFMQETHLYAGVESITKLSPGQYGNLHDLNNASVDNYMIPIKGDVIYIVAHAVVCE